MTSQQPGSFAIVAGNPTPAELAAVTAVLTHALDELAADDARAERKPPSAWERSQRPIRKTLVRGHDSWRSFSG